MKRRFDKMHGLGNDFAIFDARDMPLALSPAQARALADRHSGIGCDQIIILETSDAADIRMRVMNADGGEAGACGNAARCVVALLGRDVRIETAGGLIDGAANGAGIEIDMGAPRFSWQDIPLAYATETAPVPAGWDGLEKPYAVNVGNPHAVFFVEDPAAVPLEEIGPRIERDPLFPEGVNVDVAAIGEDGIALRVWERGTGLTRACGTGACATAAAAIRYRQAPSPVTVSLPGGALRIAWAPGETIRMTGPASHVFTGEIDLEALA
ncbi:MAG: diaminopimelate epimerase [Sphingomonadaceae bacterium]